MVNYACGFSQLESGKYFEWIIMHITDNALPLRLNNGNIVGYSETIFAEEYAKHAEHELR